MPKDQNEPNKPLKKFFGITEDVEAWISLTRNDMEIKDVRSILTNVSLDMGDGTIYNDTSVCYRYKEFGTNIVTVTGKCKECGKVYTANEKVTIKLQKPKASFEVEERGNSYSVLGKIHLRSTSTGDIENYIWFVDDKELTKYTGKPNAEIDLPKTPCNIRIKLKVIGPQSEEPSETDERTLRVRYGWWITVPAVLLLLILVILALIMCLGNGPKHWEFYTWEGPVPKQINGNYPDELGDAYLDKGVLLSGVKNWNYCTKIGKLRLGDLLLLDAVEDNVWYPFSEEVFEVKNANGTPIITPPDGRHRRELLHARLFLGARRASCRHSPMFPQAVREISRDAAVGG